MNFNSAISAGALAAAIFLGGAANAAVTLDFSAKGPAGVDNSFEGPGGYLNGVLGLPLAGNTALPPLERAVGQMRSGANQRNGLFLPTAATGLPVEDGGTGVTTALTNVGAFAATGTDFANGAARNFRISRVGSTVSYVLGGDSFTSDARASLSGANAIAFRIRSNAGSVNGIALANLVFSDAQTTRQSLGSIEASNGDVAVDLWTGIVGDFLLTGTTTASWEGDRPGGSALATQWKLLTLPASPGVIPEPATWGLMIAGFGLVGAAARRRRVVAA